MIVGEFSMSRTTMAAARPRTAAVTAALVLVAALAGLLSPGTARADTAPLDPTAPTTPVTVAADALPTVQIDHGGPVHATAACAKPQSSRTTK